MKYIACNTKHFFFFQSPGSVQLQPQTFETKLRTSPKIYRSDFSLIDSVVDSFYSKIAHCTIVIGS